MTPVNAVSVDQPGYGSQALDGVRRKINRAQATLRAGGMGALLCVAVRRTLLNRNPVLCCGKFYICRLRRLRDINLRLPYRVCLANQADLEQLAGRFPDQTRAIAERWQRGQQCLLVKFGGAIVGSTWLVQGLQEVDTAYGWRFRLPKGGGIWCHNNFVEPQHRLRGAFLSGMRGMWEFARSNGQPALYGTIDALNEVSLRAHRAAGWEVAATVRFLAVLGFRVFLATSAGGGLSVSVRFAPIVRGRHLV